MEGTLSKGWRGWWDEALHRDPSLTCQRGTTNCIFGDRSGGYASAKLTGVMRRIHEIGASPSYPAVKPNLVRQPYRVPRTLSITADIATNKNPGTSIFGCIPKRGEKRRELAPDMESSRLAQPSQRRKYTQPAPLITNLRLNRLVSSLSACNSIWTIFCLPDSREEG